MILVYRNPLTLFLIIVVTPVIGYLVTSFLAIELVSWYGISLILWVRWIWELALTNNKELEDNNQFDLRLTNISYGFMTIFYILLTAKLILNSNYESGWIDVTLIIVHTLCGFYILWITSRTSQLILEQREPTSSEVISHMINLTFYPLGIWTIHKPLYDKKQASNSR